MANNQCLVCTAYFDNRPGLSIAPVVVGVGFRLRRYKQKFQCHLVYSNQSVVTVSTTARTLHRESGTRVDLEQYLFMCKIPSGEVPTMFSLTTMQDNVTTIQQLLFIMVKDTKPQLQSTEITFAVCLMTPLYDFTSDQVLVEFIEMNRILGAGHFTVYIHSIADNVSRVLNQYVHEGVVEVVDWKINTGTGHLFKYYGQYVLMHDCLYRNMHTVKYLYFNDLDEVIVPRQDKNWVQMMAKIDSQSAGSFLARNVFYFTGPSGAKLMKGFNLSMVPCPRINVPKYYKMWYRAKDALKPRARSKYMVKPTTIVRLHIHYVYTHLHGYSTYNIPEEVAFMQHHREKAVSPVSRDRLPDRKMLDYAPEFMNALSKYLCVP